MDWLAVFKHLLPRARAWQITVEKRLRQFFQGLTVLGSDPKLFFDQIFQDIDPQKTRQLSNWEAQWALPNAGLTEQERRDRLDATWKALGGQSPRYIQDTLRAAGFDVYVHEWWVPQTEREFNYTWSNSSQLDDWFNNGGYDISIGGSILTLESTTADASITRDLGTGVPAFSGVDFPIVQVRWKTPDATLNNQLFWATVGDPASEGAKSVSWTKDGFTSAGAKTSGVVLTQVVDSEGYFVTTIDFSAVGIWNATDVTRLRFDFSSSAGKTILIDYIRTNEIATGLPLTARNPFDYIDDGSAAASTYLMVDGTEAAQDGDSVAQDGASSTPPGYLLVNKIVTSSVQSISDGSPSMQDGNGDAQDGAGVLVYTDKTYTIPADPTKYPYFLYIGGEVFSDLATVQQSRREEFENLCLKICPTEQWLGILVNYS